MDMQMVVKGTTAVVGNCIKFLNHGQIIMTTTFKSISLCEIAKVLSDRIKLPCIKLYIFPNELITVKFNAKHS